MRWRGILDNDLDEAKAFKLRIDRIEVFKDLESEDKEHIYALFTKEQVAQVNKLDTEFAINFNCIEDMRNALNNDFYLTARDKRKLV